MATTVQTRPNHYMTLGLTPAASDEEIAEAYAREIILSRVRAFGATTQVSIAYEALRDPARRKAYDESIGVRREPAAVHLPRAVSFRSSAHFISGPPPTAAPIEPKADLPPPQLVEREPKASPPSEAEAPPEPRIAPFLAAALRRPEPAPAPKREPEVPRFLQSRPSLPLLEADAEETGFNWKQPAVIVGALVGTVALVGAWAGVQAGNDVESAQPAVTIPVPSAKAAPVAGAATAAEPAAPTRKIAFERPAPRPRAIPRRAEHAESAPVAQAPSGPFEQIAESGAVEAAPALAQDAPADAESATASLPMSKATIARTIGRIGYPCGQVSSTSQVLGNVFKVTCTSGDSYRAAPVHGRYRFKRL